MQEKELYVIKIGTNALVNSDGHIFNETINEVLGSAKEAMAQGKNIIIVTSGAARVGRLALKDLQAPKKVATCVGQPVLFSAWQEQAKKVDVILAEFLISRSSIIRKELFFPIRETFELLFERGIVPVVNENDVMVSGTGYSFGEGGNDSLAQVLAVSLKASKLIIVSDIEGLCDSDPRENPDAKLIGEVDDITDKFIDLCSKKSGAGHGTGGMLSKLKSIRICTAVGVECYIVSGLINGNVEKAVRGEPVGTHFLARESADKVTERERWILAAKSSAGSIAIDKGAVDALAGGASLLAVGVKKVYGSFNEGEVIEIVDMNNHGVAFGIVDISYAEIDEMLRTKNTQKKLLVHANNLFFLK
ncbi:MAG: glutamate 5-kinase [Candidatus Pacebacteria bacterium]|nr:glutamate 5-kinase [Candidatus Paceibacterota bacterium]